MTDTLKALAAQLEAHVQEMANQCHGLTMQEWNTISNDILLAARSLRAALTQPAAVEDGWQPIETAPKDGTRMLGTDGVTVDVIRWENDADDDGHVGWCGTGHTYGGVLYDLHYHFDGLTHWRPLPPPPETKP